MPQNYHTYNLSTFIISKINFNIYIFLIELSNFLMNFVLNYKNFITKLCNIYKYTNIQNSPCIFQLKLNYDLEVLRNIVKFYIA